MNFGSILLVLAVAIYGSNANEKHYHERDHEGNSSHIEARGLIGDIADSACSFVCGSNGNTQTVAVASWKIDLTEQASVGIIIAFEGNTKALAFINVEKKIVVVFTGTKGVFGVFNLDRSTGLIINANTAVTKYVTIANSLNLFIGASANIFAGVYALANVVIANTSSVTGLISSLLLINSNFDLREFINYLSTGNTLWISLSGKSTLYATVKLSFAAIFASTSTSDVTIGGLVFGFGVLNTLVGLLGQVTGVSYGYLSIAFKFMASADGFINGNLLYQLYSQVSLYTQAFIEGKIVAVYLAADLTLQFVSAANALFSVTINGLIMVAGAIQGTISGALNILGSIIGSASIGVGVHFQAGIALSASQG